MVDSSSSTTIGLFDIKFVMYSLYAWGSPLVVVAICVALDFTSTVKFEYGMYLGITMILQIVLLQPH